MNIDQFYILSQPFQDADLRKQIGQEQDPERKQELQARFDERRNWVTLALGKMPQPFWTGDRGFKSEMLWDVDINPEGVAMNNAVNLSGDARYRLENTFGYFILEEVDPNRFAGLTSDTRAFADQLRLHTPRVTAALAYYDFQNLNAGLRVPAFDPSGFAFTDPGTSAFLLRPGVQRTNTQVFYGTDALGFPKDHFRLFNFTGQAHVPLGTDVVDGLGKPEIFLVGDYVNNMEASENGQGYGVTLGFKGGAEDAVVNPFSVWATWRDVDADAALSVFADSDLGAGTDYRGWELGANYRLSKNLLIVLSYFNFEGFPNKTNRVTRNFVDFVFSW